MSNTEQPPRMPECPSCKVGLTPDARFCHQCGTTISNRPTTTNWKLLSLAGVVAISAIAGLYLTVGSFLTGERVEAPNLQTNNGTQPLPPGQAVDLSTMSPREAADRLFNRVMAAAERGDIAEATRFAPMALNAYQLAKPLDLDARYHLGLINLTTGDIDETRRQIDILMQASPNHLLGLALSIRLAEKIGDTKAASDSYTQFTASYDTENTTGRPEYEAHRTTIEKLHVSSLVFRTNGTGRGVTKALELAIANMPETGAQLFDTNCAGCHGAGASGTDKGPPLVNKIYEPGHHSDASFIRAVRQGVQSHHWSFGDMPPIPSVTDDQINQIVSFVRALQVKNGIE